MNKVIFLILIIILNNTFSFSNFFLSPPSFLNINISQSLKVPEGVIILMSDQNSANQLAEKICSKFGISVFARKPFASIQLTKFYGEIKLLDEDDKKIKVHVLIVIENNQDFNQKEFKLIEYLKKYNPDSTVIFISDDSQIVELALNFESIDIIAKNIDELDQILDRIEENGLDSLSNFIAGKIIINKDEDLTTSSS